MNSNLNTANNDIASKYIEEHALLDTMLKCSLRYLNEHSDEQNYALSQKMSEQIREYCHRKMSEVEAECLKNTGHSLHYYIFGTELG